MHRVGHVLALIAGLALGAIIMLVIAPRTHVGTGDWLQFLGGLLGVSLAVLGAVFVEDWKQEKSRKEDRAILLDAVVALRKAVQASSAVGNIEYEGEPDVRQRMLDTYSRLESMQDLLIAVRPNTKVVDVALWQDLYKLNRVIKEDLPSVQNELQRLTRFDPRAKQHPSPLLDFHLKHDRLMADIIDRLGGGRSIYSLAR